MDADQQQLEMIQPHGAPEQKQRVMEWLENHPEGLTQLQALQELAVARLAAIVHRLRGDGHVITTELVEMPTRYGPAQVARYHLTTKPAEVESPRAEQQAPIFPRPSFHNCRCVMVADAGLLDPPAAEPALPDFAELRRRAGIE